MNSRSNTFILAAGLFLLFFSAMHFFTGYPMIKQMLAEQQSAENLVHTVKVIWVFSSIAMFLTAYWALAIYRQIKLMNYSVKRDAFILGMAYFLFGFINLFNPFPNWHLLSFALPGMLLLVGSFFLKDTSNKV